MTITDPDFVHLRDVTVKGLGLSDNQDHEGRIRTLEDKMRATGDSEVFSPHNLECMDVQHEVPYYLDYRNENPPDPAESEFMITGNEPGQHVRDNNETVKKTVRSYRHKISDGQWMLYTQIYLDVAAGHDGTGNAHDWMPGGSNEPNPYRNGDNSNHPGRPLPSGYFRLNLTELGYTGASVDSLIVIPNMEYKWGGEAWMYDIYRHSDWVDSQGNPKPAFMDFSIGCENVTQRTHTREAPWWKWWSVDKYQATRSMMGSMLCSLTIIGLSTITDLHDGKEVVTDTVY